MKTERENSYIMIIIDVIEMITILLHVKFVFIYLSNNLLGVGLLDKKSNKIMSRAGMKKNRCSLSIYTFTPYFVVKIKII